MSRHQNPAVIRDVVNVAARLESIYWTSESLGAFFSLAFRIKATSQISKVLEQVVLSQEQADTAQSAAATERISGMDDSTQSPTTLLDGLSLVILINGFGQNGMAKEAKRIFRLYKENLLHFSGLDDAIDSSIHNAYLGSLLSSGDRDAALALFASMKVHGKITWYTLNILLNDNIRRSDIKSSRQLWALATELEQTESRDMPSDEKEFIVLANTGVIPSNLMTQHRHERRDRDSEVESASELLEDADMTEAEIEGDKIKQSRERNVAKGMEIFRCTLMKALLQTGADGEALDILWKHMQGSPATCTEETDEDQLVGPSDLTRSSALCTYFYGLGKLQKPSRIASQQMVQFLLRNYTIDGAGEGHADTYSPNFRSLTDIDLINLDYRPLASLMDGYMSIGRSDLALSAYMVVYDILTQITESVSNSISSEDFTSLKSVPISARPIDACGGVLAFNIMLTAVKNMARGATPRHRSYPNLAQQVHSDEENDELLQTFKNMDRLWEFAKDIVGKRVAITLIGQGSAPINANAIEKGFSPGRKNIQTSVKWKRQKVIPEENACIQNVLQESSRILNAQNVSDEEQESESISESEDARIVEFSSVQGLGWKEIAYVAATTSKRMLLDSYSVGSIIDAANSVGDFDIAKWVWINQARLRKLPNEYTVHAFLRSFTSSEDLPFLRIVLKCLFESRFMRLERTSDEILNALVRCGSANALMCGVGALLMYSKASTPSIVAIRNSLIKFDRHWRDCTIDSAYINPRCDAAREIKYCKTSVKSEVYTEAVVAPAEKYDDVGEKSAKPKNSRDDDDTKTASSDFILNTRNSPRDVDREAIILCDLLVARLRKDVENAFASARFLPVHAESSAELQQSIDTCVPSIAALVAALLSRGDWGTAAYVLHSFSTLSLSNTLESATKKKYGAVPNSRIRSLLSRAASQSLSLGAYSAVDASITLLMRHSELEVKKLNPSESRRGLSYMLRTFPLSEHMRHKEAHLRTVCGAEGIVEFLEFCVSSRKGYSAASAGTPADTPAGNPAGTPIKVARRGPAIDIPIPISLLQGLFVDAIGQKRYVLASRVVKILQGARLIVDCQIEGFSPSSKTSSNNDIDVGATDGGTDSSYAARKKEGGMSFDVNEVRTHLARQWAAQLVGRSLAQLNADVTESVKKVAGKQSNGDGGSLRDQLLRKQEQLEALSRTE
jgi:hypothetical protein